MKEKYYSIIISILTLFIMICIGYIVIQEAGTQIYTYCLANPNGTIQGNFNSTIWMCNATLLT